MISQGKFLKRSSKHKELWCVLSRNPHPLPKNKIYAWLSNDSEVSSWRAHSLTSPCSSSSVSSSGTEKDFFYLCAPGTMPPSHLPRELNDMCSDCQQVHVQLLCSRFFLFFFFVSIDFFFKETPAVLLYASNIFFSGQAAVLDVLEVWINLKLPMERFENPLDLSDVTMWWRAHRKSLEMGAKTYQAYRTKLLSITLNCDAVCCQKPVGSKVKQWKTFSAVFMSFF